MKLTEYEQFFAKKAPKVLNEEEIRSLRQERISYNPNYFQESVSLTITDETANKQIMRLAVSFSYFMVEIAVLNSLEESVCPFLEMLNFGSFSKIYLIEKWLEDSKGGHDVIKSILYSKEKESNESNEKSLRNSIIEFSFVKLFSALKIGPVVHKIFGFDMLIFQDTVEFCMELCQPIEIRELGRITDNLYTMHSFRIIHGDIKLENIMWSPNHKKNVFIDFGLSKLIKEKPGEMTFTFYFGTYLYCSEEMKSLLVKNKKGYVDLYFNDIMALKKVPQFCKNIIQKKRVSKKKKRNL